MSGKVDVQADYLSPAALQAEGGPTPALSRAAGRALLECYGCEIGEEFHERQLSGVGWSALLGRGLTKRRALMRQRRARRAAL